MDAYRGELAAGHFWPWLQPLREALRRDVLDAYLHLAATAQPQQAVELLHDAVAVDPYNEHLNRRAAEAVDAVGYRAAATPGTGHRTPNRRLPEASAAHRDSAEPLPCGRPPPYPPGTPASRPILAHRTARRTCATPASTSG